MDLTVRSEGPWLAENMAWLGSSHGTQATRTITLDLALFTPNTHFPNKFIPSGIVLAKATATGLYGPYAGRASEVQSVTVTGTPTGGTFTLTHEGNTTAAIAYNATAGAVRSALEALPSVSPGDVTVTGVDGGPYTVTFTGGGGNVAQMTASGASLTGGTSPGVTVATVTGGGSTGTGGLETPVGHLYSSKRVPDGVTTGTLGAPLYEHGAVRVSYLPAGHGFDEYVRTALKGQIIYRP